MTEEKEQRLGREKIDGGKGRVHSVIHVKKGKETKFADNPAKSFVITNYCWLL